MKPALYVVVALGLAIASHAAVPELSGVITFESQTRLVLIDPSTGNASKWLAVGDDFSGYVIKDYQSDSATVTLERDGTTFRVALRKPVLLPPAPPSLSIQFLPDGQLALDDTPVSLPDLRRLLQARGSTREYHFRFVAYPHTNLDLVREVMAILQKNGFRSVEIDNVKMPAE